MGGNVNPVEAEGNSMYTVIIAAVDGGGSPANNAPTAVDDSATTNEDVAVTLDILNNDSDPDGDTLTVNAVSAATNGTLGINADQTVTYTPSSDFNG